MHVKYLSWHVYYPTSEGVVEVTDHDVPHPSWGVIERLLNQLDAKAYPDLFLSGYDAPFHFPLLTIIGGAGIYSAALEFGDRDGQWTGERIVLVDPAHESHPNSGTLRAIGDGYNSYELEEQFLTTDYQLVVSIVRHFVETGQWLSTAPCILEVIDQARTRQTFTD
ncbi:MAG: hypothetical protein M3R24_31500 [Chloroflexota bacterium]|nr:hypothetical protein [Chloroflexota bacterium]